MPFLKNANPFAGISKEPMQLLQNISPLEIASCVPIVKIQKIDALGKPSTDVRPLQFDLVQTPQFSGLLDFGHDADSFIERSLVSLMKLNVQSDMQYGLMLFKDVTIEFIVHQPKLVFDRNSKIPWREILEEGKSFSLEYGWVADSTIVQNPLFNGHGMVTDTGLVVKSTSTILLTVYSYKVRLMQTGEVSVTVMAKENGDIALRQSKFSDDIESTFSFSKEDDKKNIDRLKQLVDKLNKIPGKGKTQYYKIGDVLDNIIAPMIDIAAKNFGYSTGNSGLSFAGVKSIPPSPAVLLLGKFNEDCGPQSEKYFGKPMAGVGIEEFLIPRDVLLNELTLHLTSGRAIYLKTIVDLVINTINDDAAWAHPNPGVSYRKPEIMLKTDTIKNQDGSYRLVIVAYDRKTGTDPFHQKDGNDSRNFLALDKQSKSEVFRKLSDLNIPIIEFAHAGSLILDATFDFQPEPLLQAIQIDTAYKDRKDRVQQNFTPDVESRKGQSRDGELTLPVSVVEGSITMYGNFAIDVFALVWIEFFGSSEISGVFHAIGKTDSIEPGKFTSEFKFISEGLDPMNTRRRRTEQELAADRAKAAKK